MDLTTLIGITTAATAPLITAIGYLFRRMESHHTETKIALKVCEDDRGKLWANVHKLELRLVQAKLLDPVDEAESG